MGNIFDAIERFGDDMGRTDLSGKKGSKPKQDPNGWPAARVSDLSRVSADVHGCPACPHVCVGPALTGSPNVYINELPAFRVTDLGSHMACCGPNLFYGAWGSATVLINDLNAVRKGDKADHCGGEGQLVNGSPDVLLGGASVRGRKRK